MAQIMHPGSNYIPYMVWIIKIYIFPLSSPKFENLHYCYGDFKWL